MFIKNNVNFSTQDGIRLTGWLYIPEELAKPAPGIIMTHGFSALKEHHLAKFAEVFVAAGMCVLIYDHRNLGESEGEPRFEVNPDLQIQDMSDAISFLQAQPPVDLDRIGLWGTSFSGGHVLQVAANDERVKCVVAQVPFVKGHHEFLQTKRPDIWEIVQKKYTADRQARANGKSPMMTPVVTNDPEKSVVMKQPEAYAFFTSIPQWENKVTLRSVEMSGNYVPMDALSNIKVPVLFIIADQDTICLTELALKAYGHTLSPKKCVMIKGHHFVAYQEQFEICSREACHWFSRVFGDE